jgi:hypothetical protein
LFLSKNGVVASELSLFKKEFAGVFTNTGKSNQFSGKKMKK